MGIQGQAPERGQSGSFITQASISGKKVDFILPTTQGTASGSIASGGTLSITAATTLYDLSVPAASRTSENVYPWANCAVWPYFNIFIDNDNDFNYKFASGASLSSGQKNILVSIVPAITPLSGYSNTITLMFKNFDTSSHTIYFHFTVKYVITS